VDDDQDVVQDEASAPHRIGSDSPQKYVAMPVATPTAAFIRLIVTR